MLERASQGHLVQLCTQKKVRYVISNCDTSIWKDCFSAVRLKMHQNQVFAFSEQNMALLVYKQLCGVLLSYSMVTFCFRISNKSK